MRFRSPQASVEPSLRSGFYIEPFSLQSLLCMYVSYLAEQNLKHGSIKVYLSAVRNWQIASGHPGPFVGAAMPQLDQVMKGIKRVQTEKGGNKRECLPISPSILLCLKRVWSASMSEHDTNMVWAACCLCFFAFLRVGEMTVLDDMAYDPSVHPSIKDILVDNSSNPSSMCIKIKQLKTDPFHRVSTCLLGKLIHLSDRCLWCLTTFVLVVWELDHCSVSEMGRCSHANAL